MFRSGSVRVWNELYNCSLVPPVSRNDLRWMSVGVSTYQPRLKELERLHYTLNHGMLLSDEPFE